MKKASQITIIRVMLIAAIRLLRGSDEQNLGLVSDEWSLLAVV